jgi:hypothetical protein
VEDAGTAVPADAPIGVESPVRGTETLLENTELRNQFLTDLLEVRSGSSVSQRGGGGLRIRTDASLYQHLQLQVFLKQRRADFDVRDDFASFLHEEQQRNAPPSVQQNKEGVEAFLKAVNAVIDALHARKTRQLIEIKNSNKYDACKQCCFRRTNANVYTRHTHTHTQTTGIWSDWRDRSTSTCRWSTRSRRPR